MTLPTWSSLFSHKEVKKYAIYLALALLVLGFVVFFTKFVVFLLFLGGAALSALLMVVIGTRTIAIEFISFPTSVLLYAYGLKESLIFLWLSLLIYIFITHSITIHSLLSLMICPIFLLPMIPFMSFGIVKVGIAWVFIVNLIFTILTIFYGTGHIHKRMIFFATDMLLVWFLFTRFAEPVVKLIS